MARRVAPPTVQFQGRDPRHLTPEHHRQLIASVFGSPVSGTSTGTTSASDGSIGGVQPSTVSDDDNQTRFSGVIVGRDCWRSCSPTEASPTFRLVHMGWACLRGHSQRRGPRRRRTLQRIDSRLHRQAESGVSTRQESLDVLTMADPNRNLLGAKQVAKTIESLLGKFPHLTLTVRASQEAT